MKPRGEISGTGDKGFVKSIFAWSGRHKYILTIILALLAVGLEVYYSICGGSCSYLRGDLFGIDLQYIGIAYMAFIVLLSVMKKDLFLILTLSAGLGVEMYLVGFQVWHDAYCPYCLAFGGVLMMMFFLNMRKAQIKLASICAALSLILFALFFKGSATPSYAAEVLVPSFGSGKVVVRIYTDYFCPPCRAMEPKIEPLLVELVKKNVITLTFVDTPLYKASPLYARYFLYILSERKDFDLAMAARSALIGASLENITDPLKLEGYLGRKGIKFKPFDAKPTLTILNGYLKEDKIQSTPNSVIIQDGKTARYTGGPDIADALERLKQDISKSLQQNQ